MQETQVETPDEPEDEPTPAPGTEPTPEEEEEEAQPQPDEPEPEAQQPPSSLAEAEKIGKAVEAERKRHTTRVSTILEEAATDVFPCPLCGEELQGFLYPGSTDGLDEEARRFAYALLGMKPPSALEPAPGVIECPTCKGHGVVATPSHAAGHETLVCAKCNGTGWINDPGQQPDTPVYTLPVQAPPPPPGTLPTAASLDAWGRPLGHAHYGRDPASVGA